MSLGYYLGLGFFVLACLAILCEVATKAGKKLTEKKPKLKSGTPKPRRIFTSSETEYHQHRASITEKLQSEQKQLEVQEQERQKKIKQLEELKVKRVGKGHVLGDGTEEKQEPKSTASSSSTVVSSQNSRDKVVAEQDQQYNKSLAADKLKEQQKLEKIKKDRERLKALKEKLPAEESLDSPKKCRLQIRLPFGDRVSRVFSLENKLSSVFDFVESYGITLTSKFEIVAFYPRRVWKYSSENEGVTLQDANLKDQDTLYVQEEIEQ